MDEDLQKTWDRVASGDTEDIDIRKIQRKLLYVCFEKAGQTDPEQRLSALKVASYFTPDDRLRLVDPMITDSDEQVRRYAFNLAVAAHKEGITALKTCVGGKDEELAAEALGLLITQVDITSSLHAREWLRSDYPRVRAGASMLLGHIAGPAMSVHLGRLAEKDPVYGVRVLAAEAAKRCSGELPKNTSQNFWEAGGTPIVLLKEPVVEEEVPAVSLEAPPLPQLDHQRLPTLNPADAEEESEGGDAALPAPSKNTTLIPSTPADAPEEVRDQPRDWRNPSALPSALPTEPGALLKLIGMVAMADRAAVHSAFMNLDESERSSALRRWMPGADAAMGRGTAIMLAALGQNRSTSMLRQMLSDEDDGIRAGAAEAVGTIGSLSMIPPLSNVLTDPDPDVRIAAIRGLTALLSRTERFSMLRERIEPLTEDKDAKVKEAAEAALATLP